MRVNFRRTNITVKILSNLKLILTENKQRADCISRNNTNHVGKYYHDIFCIFLTENMLR